MASPDIRHYNPLQQKFDVPRQEPPPGVSQLPSETRPAHSPVLATNYPSQSETSQTIHFSFPRSSEPRPQAGGRIVRKNEEIYTGQRVANLPGSEVMTYSWDQREDCNTPQEIAPICPFLQRSADIYICKGERKNGEPLSAVYCPLIPQN